MRQSSYDCRNVVNQLWHTMTSSNGNILRVTDPLCGEFSGHRWITLTKASGAELWNFLWSAPWINGWVDNREAGNLRRHRAQYDVIVMKYGYINCMTWGKIIWLYNHNMTKHNLTVADSMKYRAYSRDGHFLVVPVPTAGISWWQFRDAKFQCIFDLYQKIYLICHFKVKVIGFLWLSEKPGYEVIEA